MQIANDLQMQQRNELVKFFKLVESYRKLPGQILRMMFSADLFPRVLRKLWISLNRGVLDSSALFYRNH